MRIYQRLTCITFTLLFAVTLTSYANPLYSHVIFFGDSLSDTGNNTWCKITDIPPSVQRGAPITNRLHKPTPNNPLWVNHFAANTTLPFKTSELKTYTELSQTERSTYNNNINYAWASAETGDTYLNDLSSLPYSPINTDCGRPGQIDENISCVPGVLEQIRLYLQDIKGHPDPQALFIIWAGGNDLFNNIIKMLGPKPRPDLSHPVDNLHTAVATLIYQHVPRSHIYVINMPNIAETPAGRDLINGRFFKALLVKTISYGYNTLLNLELTHRMPWQDNIDTNLPPGHVISGAQLFNHILTSTEAQKKFGLNNVVDACTASYTTQFPQCDGYLFFNSKHPTITAGSYISANVLQQIVAKPSR